MSDLFTAVTDAWMAAPSGACPQGPVTGGGPYGLTSAEAGQTVRALTASLKACGAGRGEPVMQVTARRPDWAVAAAGLMASGRAWLPVPAGNATGLALHRTGARWAILEDAGQLEALSAARAADVISCTPIAGGRWQLAQIGPEPGAAAGWATGLALPSDAAYLIPTSGSTGPPKWVVGSRRGLEHFIRWELDLLGPEPGLRFAQQTPVVFDPVLREVFVAFASRGCLCVPGDIQRSLDPATFAGWLDDAGIGVLHATPTLMRALVPVLTGRPALPRLRHVLLAGEELFSGDLQALMKHYGPRLQIYNLYGPTETTLAKFCHRVAPEDIDPDEPDRRIPVGRPIRGATAINLTPTGSPCIPGETGEVYIRTDYRSHGYLGEFRGDASAAAFTANPFSDDPADVVFATRDLAYARADGAFVIVGRADRTVKVRGVRVDLAVVESVLRSLDGVTDAAVRPWRATGNNVVVVAYVAGPGKLDPGVLRSVLRARLGGSAIPAVFRQLDGLPRTASGKTDLRALPAPGEGDVPGPQSSAGLTGPEREILRVFNDVIPGAVGPDDELIDIGGQSIEAAQIAVRVGNRYGVELPLSTLLDHSSPRALAAYLAQGTAGAPLPRRPGPEHEAVPAGNAVAGPAAPAGPLAPASYAQLRFWAMQRLAPDTPQLHYVWAQRLSGAVSQERLAHALHLTVSRHAAVRTRFVAAGEDLHQAFDVRDPVEMTVGGLPAGDQDGGTLAAALADVASWAARPFAFGAEPLLRAHWVTLGPDDGLFALAGHVIVSDGWTKSVLLHDLASVYTLLGHGDGASRGPAPPQATFADFARWERQETAGRIERYAGYWRAQIGDFFDRPRLPFDHPAQGRPAVSAGESVVTQLPAAQAQKLRHEARRRRLSTTAMTCAAMLASLWWWSGEPEPAVQVPVPNRPGQRYEPVVGCFTDEVLIRERVHAGEPFAAFATRVHARLIHGLDKAVPYEALIKALYPRADRHDPALMPMMFAPQLQISRGFALPGVATTEHRVDLGTSVWPLQLYLYDGDDGMNCIFSFGTNAFARRSVERLAGCYRHLLGALAADPDQTVGTLLQGAGDIPPRTPPPRSAGLGTSPR